MNFSLSYFSFFSRILPPNSENQAPRRVLRSQTANSDKNSTTGFFLQNSKDDEDKNWSISGSALLRILPSKKYRNKYLYIKNKPEHLRTDKETKFLNKKKGQILEKSITHNFTLKQNDWGYASYIPWKHLMYEKYGYREPNGDITFEADLFADIPILGNEAWNSRKMTGFIGVKNQGATCYMNSVLQALYFTTQLTKSIYQIPTENEETHSSIPLALQRVFFELRYNDEAACTRCLTKAFGWETYDAFMQHDAQELIRKLIDSLETKMKGTKVENEVKSLFEGQTISYIKCTDVDYGREHDEIFYDIQLPVKIGHNPFEAMMQMQNPELAAQNEAAANKPPDKGFTHILDSFREYVKPDILSGDDKWDTGNPEFGKQSAEKGVKFKKFPPVLHLQLMRFNYDPYADAVVKSNDRFVFTEVLDLTEFEMGETKEGNSSEKGSDNSEDKAIYRLQAVLVHAGEHHGGHYVAYIDPECNSMWYKFDDDIVAPVSKREAMDANFGKSSCLQDDPSLGLLQKDNTNAYMLIYIRDSHISTILKPLTNDDIDKNIIERLEQNKLLEKIRMEERERNNLYMTCLSIHSSSFNHINQDLIDINNPNLHQHKVRRTGTIRYLYKEISKIYKIPLGKFRLWKFERRDCNVWRPWVILAPKNDEAEEQISLEQDQKIIQDMLNSEFTHTYRKIIMEIKEDENRVLGNCSRDNESQIHIWIEYDNSRLQHFSNYVLREVSDQWPIETTFDTAKTIAGFTK